MSPINIPFGHRYAQNRGRGLGGILRTISKVIRPFFSQTKSILKPIGREIGREGVSLLANTAKDALNGTSLSNAFKTNLVKKKRKVVRRVRKKLNGKGKRGVGRGKAKGKGKTTVKGRGKAKGKGTVRKGKGKGKGKTSSRGKGSGRKKVKKVSRKKKSMFDGYSL